MVFLSIAAVALCCALLIVVASMFTGFIDAIGRGASDNLGDIVLEPPSELSVPDFRKFADMLEADANIASATGVLYSRGLLHLGKGDVKRVSIWGIEPAKRAEVTTMKQSLLRQKSQAEPPDFGNHSGELAGFIGIGLLQKPDEITDEYDLKKARDFIGSKVVLTTAAARKPFSREVPAPATYPMVISDIIFTGLTEIDQSVVYMRIEDLSSVLFPDSNEPLRADIIQIRCKPGVNPQNMVNTVWQIWRDYATGELGWSAALACGAEVMTAVQKQNDYIQELRKQLGMLMVIFGVVSTGVVLLVFCIFYMVVMTKMKDIATIRAVGASGWNVAGIFIIYGAIVGLTGAIAGLAVGYVLVVNVETLEEFVRVAFGLKLWSSSIYIFNKIPSEYDWLWAIKVFIAAIVASTLGAILPAIAAAKSRPVRILQYE